MKHFIDIEKTRTSMFVKELAEDYVKAYNMEKAGKQGLVKKRITDKRGKVTTVWVKLEQIEQQRQQQLVSDNELKLIKQWVGLEPGGEGLSVSKELNNLTLRRDKVIREPHYRGVIFSEKDINNIKQNKELQLKPVTSFSRSKQIAESWVKGQFQTFKPQKSKPVLLSVANLKHGIDISGFAGVLRGQAETLTSGKLKVKTIKEEKNGVVYIEAEHISQIQQSSQKDHLIQVGEKGLELRLRKLAEKRGIKIPPQWQDIWVNNNEKAALQVTGKDTKGRKVYIYSAEHSEKSAAEKFNRLKDFVKDYPKLIGKIKGDLKKSEEAKVLYLIAKTGFRIGSDRDTKSKVQAFGASTLTSKHVKITGDTVSFDFVGKKGVRIKQSYKDKILVGILNKTGKLFNTDDKQVRDYLKRIDGVYKTKDFRTYVGTMTALEQVNKIPKPANEKERKIAITQVSKIVADKLGNTPIVSKQYYISPEVFDRW